MKPDQILPVILITIQFGSGIVYGFYKNFNMALYWIAAAVLNIAVTFKF